MELFSNSLKCGETPVVGIRKLLKPQKTIPSSCSIHAKCEFRNPSGSIWDRIVSHEMKSASENSLAFVTGGIDDLCLSLAWYGVITSAAKENGDTVSVSVLPGTRLDDTKLQLLHGFGANVVLSYQQDPNRENTQKCLEKHINNFESTCKIEHHKILPYSSQNPTENNPYNELVNEVLQVKAWNTVVCSGQDPRLLQAFKSGFPEQEVSVIAVNFAENSFTDMLENDSEGVNWVQVSDAECYDMARRLVREEGLLVGPISGGIMAAALKHAASTSKTTSTFENILVILPDSLQNSSRDFLSVDWMVQKGYYSVQHLESLYWWYEMAVENINPPEVLVVTPETLTKHVNIAMNSSSTDRCVVASHVSDQEKQVVGVVTRESLAAAQDQDAPIGNVCIQRFGLIDSKANFSELEHLLRKYNWVVNMHRTPIFTATNNATCNELQTQMNEEILGAVNLADFINYKRKIERHHLTEFGLAMSDGTASDVWLERFNEHLQNVPAIKSN